MTIKVLLVAIGAAGAVLVGGAPPPGDLSGSPLPPGPPPGKLLVPVIGYQETQRFGCTSFTLEPYAAWCPTHHFHSGVDLAARLGTPVRAAAAGTAHIADDAAGYGLHVGIDHGGGLSTLYGHLSAALVTDGQQVAAGSEIGLMGSSGMSTGPHLHFEVRRDGRPVDPAPYLPVSV